MNRSPSGVRPARAESGGTARAARRDPLEVRGRAPLAIKTRGIMFGRLVPIPTDPVVDPPPKVCYNCWQGGHPLLKCPRRATRYFCNNCGRSGVAVYACPRCRAPNTTATRRSKLGTGAEPPLAGRERGNAEREERSVEEAGLPCELRLRRLLVPEPHQSEP